jgi:hypothetical protein
MESALRPRDIQARIRAGESPEAVAAAAATTVERIVGFAAPVLAERAHIADRAQRSSVRGRAGEGPTRVLADAVAERLGARGSEPAEVHWDSWRRDDGRWTVVVDYRSGDESHHAEFLYDVPGRYVLADDDEARWLVGELSARPGDEPPSGGPARRLAAVHDVSGPAPEELPLGADAIELVSEPRGAEVRLPAQGDATSDAAPGETPDGTPEETPEETPEDIAAKPSRKRGRPSVPSWDEIMFGGAKQE